jgi:hypothetical protein
MLCAQKPLLSHFGAGRLATDLTAGDLKTYRDARLESKAPPATINREMSCLRRGFSLARRDGILDRVTVFPILEEDNVRSHRRRHPAGGGNRSARTYAVNLRRHVYPLLGSLSARGATTSAFVSDNSGNDLPDGPPTSSGAST